MMAGKKGEACHERFFIIGKYKTTLLIALQG